MGSPGFCRIWILGFAEVAKPLYEATSEPTESFMWTEKHQKVFGALKTLLSAPALVLWPDVTRTFDLFMVKGMLWASKRGIDSDSGPGVDQ